MQKRKTYIIIILVLVVFVGAFMVSRWPRGNDPMLEGWGATPFIDESTQSPSIDTSNWAEYSDDMGRFSFRYPPDYSVGEIQHEGSRTLLIQNTEKMQGFQIYITTIGETFEITPELIQTDIPDMTVDDPQPVLLAEGSPNGLAFLSDNEAFGGHSREVWFTFNGELYQISTYASLDTLLQAVMNTWTFK